MLAPCLSSHPTRPAYGVQPAQALAEQRYPFMNIGINFTGSDQFESECAWYAISTRPRHEKRVSLSLVNKGYQVFLPLDHVEQIHHRSPRHTWVPLFPGYLLCRLRAADRWRLLSTPGVISILGRGKRPVPVPDDEVLMVHRITQSGRLYAGHVYLAAGTRVRVRGGPLDQLEGILVREKAQSRVVISVHLLSRSVAVELSRDQLEPAV